MSQPPERPVRVAVVGPRASARGGVARSIHAVLESPLSEQFELVPVATYRDGSRLPKLVQAAGGLARLARLSLGGEVDIVHVHSSWGPSFARKALAVGIAHAAGTPVVLQLHGSSFQAALRRGGLRGRLARGAFGRVAAAADAIVAATPAWASEVGPIAGVTRVHVVPNAADVAWDAGARRGTPDPPTILFLGRLERRKGIFDLLDVFVRLRRTRPLLGLVIAGRGTDERELRRAVAARGLDDAVVLPGWVDGEAKARLLADASCLVLPSYAEGLPLAVLEAMLSGVPVVATRVGGIPEAARDGREALLVPPEDPAALEAAVARLLDDGALAARLARAAQHRALAHFVPARVAEDVADVYRSVLGAERIGPAAPSSPARRPHTPPASRSH